MNSLNPHAYRSIPRSSQATVPMPVRYEFLRLCEEISDFIDAGAARRSIYLANALAYANAGKTLASTATSPRDLTVQALYILTNLQYWRHPEAKQLRNRLRTFSQQK